MRAERSASLTFAAAIAAAVPTILWTNRHQWFFLDDWDFLAQRNIHSLDDLMRPHNEHWSLIPIVLYRVIFQIDGLHHYRAYQLLVVAAHLGAAVLLRTIMRRAGVHPWLATAAAVLFAFFGAGREDIEAAFQVSFSGSLAFGLAAIVLADHDRDDGFDRRDLLALLCGLASLMCSGIGVTMVVALGVSVAVRRGWKHALGYVLPLGGTFIVWYEAEGHRQTHHVPTPAHKIVELAWNTVRQTFSSLGHVRGVGVLLALVLLGGGALAVARQQVPELRHRYASIVGLLVAALWFVSSTAYGRAALDVEPASRYLHLTAAMVLPAVAVAATALATRWRVALPVLVLLFLVGLPGNIRALEPRGPALFTLGGRDMVLNIAAAAPHSHLPRSYQPLPREAPGLTIGFLQDEKALGRIPDPPPQPLQRAAATLALSVEQLRRAPSSALVCRPQDSTTPFDLRRDAVLVAKGAAMVRLSRVGAGQLQPSAAFPSTGTGVYLRSAVGRLMVRVATTPTVRTTPVRLTVCRPS